MITIESGGGGALVFGQAVREVFSGNEGLSQLLLRPGFSIEMSVEWTDPRTAIARFNVEPIEDPVTDSNVSQYEGQEDVCECGACENLEDDPTADGEP